MTTHFLVDDLAVQVPDWVTDLESFRRWADHDDFPEVGQISYLSGNIWIDLSMEQLYSHTDVKSEINTVLRTLVRAERLGRYYHDGAFLTNVEADVSNQPDGTFVSAEALREGRVRAIEGKTEGYVELEGAPDMVLEVVSRSSVAKDTSVLRKAYATAGVREYWLVDARGEAVKFDILRPGRDGYSAVRKRGGWARSEIFGRWFRLTRSEGEDGYPEFTLETRPDAPA